MGHNGGVAVRASFMAIIAACVALAACSQSALLEKISSPEDRALSLTVIGDLEQGTGGDADLTARLSPQVRDGAAKILPQLHAMMPAGQGATSRLVDAKSTVMSMNGVVSRQSYLGYEIAGGGKRALLRLVIERRNGAPEIQSLYVNPLYKPVDQINAFTLTGKSFVQYLVLALSILSVGVILTSLVVLVRTKGVRRKWLWGIGCLIAVCQVWVDWSSGAWGVNPLNLQILGAFAVKPGLLESWRVGFGIPLVAIIFLVRRRQLQTGPSAPIDREVFSR